MVTVPPKPRWSDVPCWVCPLLVQVDDLQIRTSPERLIQTIKVQAYPPHLSTMQATALSSRPSLARASCTRISHQRAPRAAISVVRAAPKQQQPQQQHTSGEQLCLQQQLSGMLIIHGTLIRGSVSTHPTQLYTCLCYYVPQLFDELGTMG